MNNIDKIITIIILLWSSFIQAQTIERETIEAVKEKLSNIDSLLNLESAQDTLFPTQYIKSDSLKDYHTSLMKWKDAQNRKYSAKTGLELTGGYDYRFGSKTYNDLSDEFFDYSHRFQLGLSWNIMRSGLIGCKPHEERTELLAQQKLLQINNVELVESIKQSNHRQIAIIHAYYNKIANTKLELYSLMLNIEKVFGNQNYSNSLDMAEFEYQLSRNQSLQLRATNFIVDNFFDVPLYISLQEISDTTLIDSMMHHHPILSNANVEEALLLNEYYTLNYWKDVKINPYIRANYYMKKEQSDKLNTSVGISLSIPLSRELKAQKYEVEYRKELYTSNQNFIQQDIRNKLEIMIDDLDLNYSQLLSMYVAFQHHKRKCNIAQKIFANNGITITYLCNVYIDMLDCVLEICNLVVVREDKKASLVLVGNKMSY